MTHIANHMHTPAAAFRAYRDIGSHYTGACVWISHTVDPLLEETYHQIDEANTFWHEVCLNVTDQLAHLAVQSIMGTSAYDRSHLKVKRITGDLGQPVAVKAGTSI